MKEKIEELNSFEIISRISITRDPTVVDLQKCISHLQEDKCFG